MPRPPASARRGSAEPPPGAACAADEARLTALGEALAAKAEEVEVLRQVSSQLNTTLNLERIHEIVLRTMDDLFGFRHALILLLDPEQGHLEVVASRGYPDSRLGARVPLGAGVIGLVAQRKRMMRIGNLGSRRSYARAVQRETARVGAEPAPERPAALPGLPDAESQIAIPLRIGERLIGVFSVESAERRVFSERDETLVTIVANLAASALHNALEYRREEVRRASLETTVEQRERELELVREIRAKESPRFRLEDFTGDSPAVRATRELLRKVARSPASTVLLLGENGTGKDLAAKVIHHSGSRARAPFMNITCSALPENLLESELFGHEAGAFTDARKEKRGLFELASGGTVFLDEIGEMSLGLQARLLRFLEEKTFKRVGGSRDIRVDVRIIAATHRDLAQMTRDGRFREDLYYRLRVLPVELPALRERRSDIPLLVQRFLEQYQREFKTEAAQVAPDALERLLSYSWPGNVRELRNAVERAMLLAEGATLRAEDFRGLISETAQAGVDLELPADGLDIEALEAGLVRQAFARARGNKARAARLLRVPRDWLRYRVEKLGLD